MEGGEGEAGGSCLERRAEEIYGGRGEVINAQEEWETVRQGLQAEPWRMVSPSSASSAQPRLCCSICLPAAPSERPWGPGECICMLGVGEGCHRPAGTASVRLLPERTTFLFLRGGPSQPAYIPAPSLCPEIGHLLVHHLPSLHFSFLICMYGGVGWGEVITPLEDLRNSNEIVIWKCTLSYIRMCDSVHTHITLTFSLLHLDDLANS